MDWNSECFWSNNFMMPYLFKIGSFELRIYSLMIILALLLGLFMIRRRAKALGYDPEKIENMVVLVFVCGLIGARIYYVIFAWDNYKNNLWEIFAIWHGGLAIHGGIIFGIMAAGIYAYYKKMSILFMGDMIFPWMLIGQGMGRLGNFTNGEAHGVPTLTPPEIIFRLKPAFNDFWSQTLSTLHLLPEPRTISKIADIIREKNVVINFEGKDYLLREFVPWGISFPAKFMPQAYIDFGTLPVHPTFFYEMILNFIGGAIMYYFWRQDKWISTGVIMGMYLAFYGLIRGFVTFFRADDLMIGFLRAPHLASIALIIAGSGLIIHGVMKTKKLKLK